MIHTHIKFHQLVFLRESTTKPGEGTILIAWEGDARFWWLYDSHVDGVEYYPPAPAHRLVDPLSVRPGERSLDYSGIQYAHKRIRLTEPPAKLLAALEQAKKRQQPRVVIHPRRWKVILWRLKRSGLRTWRQLRDWARQWRK